MEHLGANSEGWNSINGMSSEESDFMEQLLCSLSNEEPSCSNLLVSLSFWPYNHEPNNTNNRCSSDNNTNDNSNNVYAILKGHDNCYSYNTHHEMSTADYYKTKMEDAENNSSRIHVMTTADAIMEADEFLNNDVLLSNDNISTHTDSNKNMLVTQLRSIEIEKTPMQETLEGDQSKKRSRNISGEVQKNARNINIKRAASKTDDNDDTNNTKHCKNDSSSMCSEEISSDSHGAYNVVSASSSPKDSAGRLTLNLNGKVRANRGSATDPQSLYARKRRERINERLRILQNLVPNGTKVDISTMLEEAVQYVKFLQLQIKLLSSDDLWMYAPLAYNGMEIGQGLII